MSTGVEDIPADPPGQSPNGVSVLDRVREAREAALRNGEPPPGRDKLMEMLGVPEYPVRKALETIRQEDTSTPPVAPPEPDSAAAVEEAPAPTPYPRGMPGTQPGDGGATHHQPDTLPAPAPPVHTAKGAKTMAWVGFVFGATMSIAGNVLSTWLPAHHQPPGWTPALETQIGAAVWSIGLLISIEILTRSTVQGVWWRTAIYLGAGVLAVGSGLISFGHMHALLLAWNYGELGAVVGPLVLDGLMVVSGFTLLAIGKDQPASRSGGRS